MISRLHLEFDLFTVSEPMFQQKPPKFIFISQNDRLVLPALSAPLREHPDPLVLRLGEYDRDAHIAHLEDA